MIKRILLGILIFILFGSIPLFSQQATVKVSLDSAYLLIGSQMNITLEVTKGQNQKVTFPTIIDTITRTIEVLEVSPIDSVLTADQSVRLSQKVTVTSFEGGYHLIPAFRFSNLKEDGIVDTLLSNSLALEVLLVPVDTAGVIKPIKAPEHIPYTLKEILPWAFGGLLLTALIWGIIWYLKRQKKQEITPVLRLVPKALPHEIAYRELDKLKKENLWQSGKTKAFHSRLSEIIRTYVEHRFQIRALERTNDEILQSFKHKGLENNIPFEELRQLLYLADLVKFAKSQPPAVENQQSSEQAYDFVRNTIRKETTEIKSEQK